MEKEEIERKNDNNQEDDAKEENKSEINNAKEEKVPKKENKGTKETHTNEKTKISKHTKFLLKAFIAILLFICFLVTCTIAATIGFVVEVIREVPSIEFSEINTLLNQHSVIYDAKGEALETIQTIEFRDIIEFDRIPPQVQNAFIAIEDERFETHRGIDFKRIVGAFLINIKERSPAQGASTITQQLIKNLYLSEEVDRENLMNDIRRKIKEAYLAIQVEKYMTKDEILHTYLNTINLGQGAYGVQEAAKTYFDKEVEELTIGESAILAGITKNPSRNAPYFLRLEENIEEEEENLIGYLHLIGNRYGVLYNPNAVVRQKIVLQKMQELGYITKDEYNLALQEDIKAKLKPREKENMEITSFLSDLAKDEVIAILMKEGFSKKEAERKLYTGGLRIYTTIDTAMQKRIEDVYENFGEILAGNIEKRTTPILTEWRSYNGSNGNLDRNNNLVDNRGKILYYKQDNLLTEENALIMDKSEYVINNDGLELKSNKFNIYSSYIGIKNYYKIDDKKNLVFHQVGNLSISKNDYRLNEDKTIIISNNFLEENSNFYEINAKEDLLISPKYFTFDDKGVVQPQSAMVILEHSTGKIKAMVGGRDVTGRRILNRATVGYRQPGSSMKPLAVYLPALDNGYTAASVIDDIPHYDIGGRLWPRNWYNGYRGLTSLRKIAVDSINVATVKLLKEIGIETSMEYLGRMGIINEKDPSLDSFISKEENPNVNDENLAALGLGGLTRGVSPLAMTAAYGAIANDGVYIKPTTIEKILDPQGSVIYQYHPEKSFVVEAEIAHIMTDILQDAVTYGTGNRASLYTGNQKIPVAGKTGTTNARADAWFAGYTPYYSAALWIGNDIPQLNLTEGSRIASIFWREVMLQIHEDLEAKAFEMSENLVKRAIDIDTGKLPTSLTKTDPRGNRARIEIFAPGTVPTEHGNTRVELRIDKTTNKLAGPYCPEEYVVSKTFIKTNPPYDPSKNAGILPHDFSYRAPLTKCSTHQENTGLPSIQEEKIEEFIDADIGR
ncbi:penicillin-binding protein 1A [Natronincola peptidivorans]|uniref:Penicillin-binding protein 1A n=1 Tax=Natronincola peptidivorans TaxID=426128 RepID=A0A1I0FAW8_9FIRM|nr:PBP1A family penicillin-binding protein [Natronincola peptidivorans]SET54659.1 penicillin-binding protein 1A [Natronincola peptidivorans]